MLAGEASASRIKDISAVEGVRDNQLVGYGLIVGLNGTGDKSSTVFTGQTLTNMLAKLGIQTAGQKVDSKNIAAVMVTATLPPFARPGDKVDVTVSTLGDSQSLQGGTLVMTPLKAADQNVYVVAQGPVSLGGGFSAEGASSSVQKNHPTAGRVINGGIVERSLNLDFQSKDELLFKLFNPDFTTASRLAKAINDKTNSQGAVALDASTVRVKVPAAMYSRTVDFMASIENINVTPDFPAKVVLNEKTGTVVMGESVGISTVAVSHGNLTIEINTEFQVSQPAPLANGQTTVVPNTDLKAKEQKAHLIVLDGATNIGDVVRALNAVGTTPRDLIAILQALKAAGALQADLEVI
ncbi:MAG TPA: flagellar basal body P-ring protein FlgI [Nitrospirota bacterium]